MSTTKVITGKVRFSYLHVLEPTSMEEGGVKKYSVSLIIPKKDKTTIAKIEAAIAQAKEEGKNSKFAGKIPAKLDSPLRDGDEERPDDDVYANSMFVTASSTRRPGMVDADLNAIFDAEEVYSGMYGRASINFYAYNVGVNKGIACGLNNLQKLEDGERLGASFASAEDDFGDDLM